MLCIGYFQNTLAADDGIRIKVSTYVPWASCKNVKEGSNNTRTECAEGSEWCFMECTIPPGIKGVSGVLWAMIKYATFLAALGWVLFIVVSGIEYTMSSTWGDAEGAKKHIKQVLIGLALLFLSWYILYAIAPWVYTG